MNDRISEKIKEIGMDRKRCNSYLLKRSKVFKDYVKMGETAFAEGKISKKNKELIATAISVISNCESCMDWHIHEAFKAGADEQEIVEAIGIAIHMGVGPVTVNSRFAVHMIEHYRPELVKD
jgi:AhpD family alkylhydroperoxidase